MFNFLIEYYNEVRKLNNGWSTSVIVAVKVMRNTQAEISQDLRTISERNRKVESAFKRVSNSLHFQLKFRRELSPSWRSPEKNAMQNLHQVEVKTMFFCQENTSNIWDSIESNDLIHIFAEYNIRSPRKEKWDISGSFFLSTHQKCLETEKAQKVLEGKYCNE